VAKRTVIRQLPDGSTEVKSTGCLGGAIAWLVGISLLIYALVSPAQDYPWWEAMLTYLGMAVITGLAIWGYVRHQRKVKAQTPGGATLKQANPTTPPMPPAASPKGVALSTELTRLAALHRNGALSDAEFQTAKNRLLDH